jgi:hypothetical protein
MTLEQLQAISQNPKPEKKLTLQKETIKDLALGKRTAWPGETCDLTDEDPEETAD